MKQLIKNPIVIAISCLITGVIIGAVFFNGGETKAREDEHADHGSVMNEQGEWTCAMHPQIRQDEQGHCPICGMELTKMNELKDSPLIVEMTKEAMKLADIQTSKVTYNEPEKQVQLQGKVKVDERNISLITARYPGRIEKLYVDFTGKEVYRGQKLASIYSPQLITAQQELFEAIKYKSTNPILYNAARNKLKLWNLTDAQINAIEQGGEPKTAIDVLSPLSGVVTKRMTTLGEYVKEGTSLFEVVDLDRVWIIFDAYESDIPWLHEGDEVHFNVSSLPGKQFSGKISFIDPVVNPVTRTVSVRVVASNKDRQLKPEMFTNGTVHARLPIDKPKLIVPKPAVMWTGERSIVYVKVQDTEKPTFQFREIKLGLDLGTHFIVEEGLEEGEEVVSNGTFKVDAAAQLAGKNSMMNEVKDGSYIGKEGVPESFKQQLTLFFHEYTDLKNALVNSDEKEAKKMSQRLLQKLEAIDMEVLDKDAYQVWMGYYDKMKIPLETMVTSTKLDNFRESFKDLSLSFSAVIETFGIHGVIVYKDYCPMAMGDEGAYWLSETKEIRNPYYGEEMLKCGEVKRVFDATTKNSMEKPITGHQH